MSQGAAARAVTEDRLLGGRVRLQQPASGYRVAIDPVLLAAAVPAGVGEIALDLGCGGGAASLCLHHRVRDCRIVGLEIDADMFALAQQNVRLNGAGEWITLVQGDVAEPPPQIAPQSFDQVFSNPPFLQADRADGRGSNDSPLDIATIEGTANLSVWMAAMIAALKPKGRLTVIHRADRLDDLLAELRCRAGEIVVFPLWPKPGRPAKRVLVTARIGVATPLRMAPGLVLHQASGAYTPEARDVLENGAALVI